MSVQRFHDAFSLDSARRRFLFKDDFLGDQLQDLWTPTGDAGGSAVVVDAQTGGIVRITTDGDSADDWRIEWNSIRSLLVSKNVIIEARVRLNSVVAFEFTLDLYNNAQDRISFLNSGTTLFIRCEDGNIQTALSTGITLDTDWHIYRIECTPTAVHFYYDDAETTNSPITTNIPPDFLQPRLFLNTTENVAKTMDIDYVVISQER